MGESNWDKRYREGDYADEAKPHELLERLWGFLPPEGLVVDIAAGTGRDLLFLAQHGFSVCALDRSWEGVRLASGLFRRHNLHLDAIQGDALSLPLRHRAFDGVLVFYFLEREIMRDLVSLLKPGGVLVYETFLKGQNAIDRHRNPAFLLDDGELPGHFSNLETLFHEEGVFFMDGKERAVARYVGRKP